MSRSGILSAVTAWCSKSLFDSQYFVITLNQNGTSVAGFRVGMGTPVSSGTGNSPDDEGNENMAKKTAKGAAPKKIETTDKTNTGHPAGPKHILIPTIEMPKSGKAVGVYIAEFKVEPHRPGHPMFETPAVQVDAKGVVYYPEWQTRDVVEVEGIMDTASEIERLKEKLADEGFEGLARFCSYEVNEDGVVQARVVSHYVGQGDLPARLLFQVASTKPGHENDVATEMILCHVPGGPFLYGDDKKTMALPSFYVAMTPTTVGQYRAFVEDTGYTETNDAWRDPKFEGVKQTDDHPVVYVNWYNATAFATWAGMRLPTEHEVEKSIRGTDGRKHPWGDNPPEETFLQWSGPCAKTGKQIQKHGTSSVYDHPDGRSPYGVLDAAGNVWIWTSSK